MDRQYLLGQFALALILIINVVLSKKIYKNKYNNNNNNNNKQQYDDAIVSLVEEESKDLACGNFSAPTFCDMINWQVAKTRLVATDNQEMIIQMAFFNQPGTWNCKKEYKEMQCRIAFPKCSSKGHVVPPCRTSCEDFARRCPGSDVSCEDLINNDKDCYAFNYQSYIAEKEAKVDGASTLRGWPVVLLTFVVLGILYGLAFATQKAQKNFEKNQ